MMEFSTWASQPTITWDAVHQMFLAEGQVPGGGAFGDVGSSGIRGITKARWIELLRNKGLKDAALASEVFEEIIREKVVSERRSMKPGAEADARQEPTIWLTQLKRWEAKAVAASATLTAGDEQSPANRFVRFLRQKRGCVVRAWRLDIDVRGAGKVAQTDFTNACRKLGMSGQGKLIWENLRPDSSKPLEVHDLDQAETENFEDFADTLWNTVGFDLSKAWVFFDTNNQNHLSYEEFKSGVKRLGFRGDCKLLFKGLDAEGLGRLKKSEFEYISKISRLAQRKLGGKQQSHNAVADLISWVQRELGGARELLVKLGLGGAGSGASDILVGDLAARLTALGFEGDALGAASRAARTEGGTHVSAEALFSLLSGTKPANPDRPKSLAPQGSPSRSQGGRKAAAPMKEWNNSVDDISGANLVKCNAAKAYFATSGPKRAGSAGTLRAPQPPAASLAAAAGPTKPQPGAARPRPASARRARGGDSRPGWNDNYDATSQVANEAMSSHTRKYFSDPYDKPVRDRQRAVVEIRQQRGGHVAWSVNAPPESATASY